MNLTFLVGPNLAPGREKFCQLKMMCFLNLSHMYIQLEIIIWAFYLKKAVELVTQTQCFNIQCFQFTYLTQVNVITLCMFIYTVMNIQHVLTWI